MTRRAFLESLILLVLTLGLPLAAHGEIRDSLAIIRVEPSERTTNALKDGAHQFEENGDSDTAEDFRRYAKGWHGTAFAIRNSWGDVFFVTNQHVTGAGGAFTLELPATDTREALTISEGLAVYEDPILDLSLISIPERHYSAVEPLPLDWKGDYQKDGKDVYAAGFPGLLGKPSWQLTKGIISNKATQVDRIINQEETLLIQHTASIDPGSSGGPLLVKEEEEWFVVGINTWSITNRNNTFFAIPSDEIVELTEWSTGSTPYDFRDAYRRYLDFINSETWDTTRDHRLVSQEFTLQNGWHAFLNLIQSEAEKDKKAAGRLSGQNPFQILRESSSWWIWDIYGRQADGDTYQPSPGAPETAEPREGNRVETTIQGKRRELKVAFVYHRGNWLVDETEFPFTVAYKKNLDLTGSSFGEEEEEQPNKLPVFVYGAMGQIVLPVMNKEYAEPGGKPAIPGGGGLAYTQLILNKYLSAVTTLEYFTVQTSVQMRDEMTDKQYWEERDFQGIANSFGLTLGKYIFSGSHLFHPHLYGTLGYYLAGSLDGEEGHLRAGIVRHLGGGLSYLHTGTRVGFQISLFKRDTPLYTDFQPTYTEDYKSNRLNDLVLTVGFIIMTY